MSGASTFLDFRRCESPHAKVTAPVRKSSATWISAASSVASISASGSPAAATAFLFRLCEDEHNKIQCRSGWEHVTTTPEKVWQTPDRSCYKGAKAAPDCNRIICSSCIFKPTQCCGVQINFCYFVECNDVIRIFDT